MFIVVLEQRPLKRWTSPSQFNSIKTVLFQRQSSVELAQRVARVTAGTESVSLKSNPHSTRSSSWITFEIPFMKSDLGKTAFSALAPSTWNQLQDTFKLVKLPSIGKFKELIMDYCISVCTCFNWMSSYVLASIECHSMFLVVRLVLCFSNFRLPLI